MVYRIAAAVQHQVRLQAVVLVALSVLLTACAATPWKPVSGPVGTDQWLLEMPPGWMQFSAGDYEMYSKDGPYLQYILVQARPLLQGFRNSALKLKADMLPHEAAQVVIDNLRADSQIAGFQLLGNEPATLDGLPGFKLLFSYRNPQGVEVQSAYYGVVLPHAFFNMRYTAARRHYFARDLMAFEQVRQSLRLRPS
jgi:hypothetical protein